MTLGELLAGEDLGPALSPEIAGLAVAALSADSRVVEPGTVFFAVPGAKQDGTTYVPQAIARGAVAIVAEQIMTLEGAASVQVPNVRLALARAAARFAPGQPATIVAVTGTSGKTSVTAFVRQIWTTLGHAAASLGTIGVIAPGGADYGSLTTPDPVSLHATLDRLAAEGVTHLALEASSHGLDQHRLDGVRLAAGGFTNLSHDHLDYHGTEDAYLAAKLRLFDTLLQPGNVAVIDADGVAAGRVTQAARAHDLTVMTTGQGGDALRLVSAEAHGPSMALTIAHAGETYTVDLPLVGAFQISNALLAAGLCIATGGEPAAVIAALGTLQGAPGRLDSVGTHNGAPILVDYAHKPDALDKVLETLRGATAGRLIVVFGCGGDRDAAKRPLMGAIAHQRADVVIVTDDNPRSEDPATIRAAILAAAPGAIEIADRAPAPHPAAPPLWTGFGLIAPLQARMVGPIPPRVTGISIDTRTLQPGDLFIAIAGDTHDGHDHVRAALDKGAAAAVIDEAHANALAAARVSRTT